MLNSAILRPFKLEPHQRPIPNWLIYSSVFFVMVAVFIKLWTPISLNRWPEAFYTLTFFYGLFKERQWLWKHPMVLGLFAAIIATPLLFFINYLQDPVRAVEYAHFEKLVRVYLFVPIGYWLSFNRNYTYPFLFLAFLGFVTACLLDPELSTTLSKIASGGRVDFGLKNWEHLALWSSMFLIAWLLLIPKIQNIRTSKYRRISWFIFFVSIGACTFGFYTAQTRAAFLGLLVSILFFVLVWLQKSFRKTNRKKKTGYVFIIITLITLPTVFLLTDNPIKTRFYEEQGVVKAALKGDLSKVPVTSIGVRIHSWATALKWIIEKPVVGWGGDVRQHVINDVKAFSDKNKRSFGHLHNTLLEFLVSYGLLGSMIAFYPLIWILKTREHEKTPTYAWLLAIISNSFFITMSLFESYLFFWPGVFSLSLFISPLLADSLYFKEKIQHNHS